MVSQIGDDPYDNVPCPLLSHQRRGWRREVTEPRGVRGGRYRSHLKVYLEPSFERDAARAPMIREDDRFLAVDVQFVRPYQAR
jgi:hypothetical protein